MSIPIFVAAYTQSGDGAVDYCHAQEDEPLRFTEGREGWTEALIGLNSHKATTTMRVGSYPGTIEGFAAAILESHKSASGDFIWFWLERKKPEFIAQLRIQSLKDAQLITVFITEQGYRRA